MISMTEAQKEEFDVYLSRAFNMLRVLRPDLKPYDAAAVLSWCALIRGLRPTGVSVAQEFVISSLEIRVAFYALCRHAFLLSGPELAPSLSAAFHDAMQDAAKTLGFDLEEPDTGLAAWDHTDGPVN